MGQEKFLLKEKLYFFQIFLNGTEFECKNELNRDSS